MKKKGTYQTTALSLILSAFFLVPAVTTAQEVDTTKKELDFEQRQFPLNLRPNLNREMGGGIMTEMGSYQVPEETQYYTPPFKGQEYLDMAVEAYRKELEDRMGGNWFWKFLDTIRPYVHNGFEFGVYQIYDLPVVERDNPLFKSYNNKGKRQ